MAELVAVSLFAAGYLAITMEHQLFINKAAASLILAVVLWVMASFVLPLEAVRHDLVEAGADIFGLIIFLLTAMTLVEILVHYHLFDAIEHWLRARGWTSFRLGWAVTAMVFFLSGILDNLTITIVAIQIARRLFPKQYLVPISAAVVISANAGGAFSPIGDITTLMLWFAQKFTASQVITQGFLPSLVMAIIPAWFILRHIKNDPPMDNPDCRAVIMSRSDRAIIAATLGSFLLPLAVATLGLPPYLGLLLGLGIVWVLIDTAKRARPQPTHLDANIRTFLQQADIESIQFFVGILLAVGALHTIGVLDWLTDSLLGTAPNWIRLVLAFVGLGLGSAIVDNVPLTAAAISALHDLHPTLWVLLALTVGTGGSLLVIGSAAGVIAMGMVRELTFMRYVRTATYPAALGFAGGVVTWALQFQLFDIAKELAQSLPPWWS